MCVCVWLCICLSTMPAAATVQMAKKGRSIVYYILSDNLLPLYYYRLMIGGGLVFSLSLPSCPVDTASAAAKRTSENAFAFGLAQISNTHTHTIFATQFWPEYSAILCQLVSRCWLMLYSTPVVFQTNFSFSFLLFKLGQVFSVFPNNCSTQLILIWLLLQLFLVPFWRLKF